MNHKENPAKPGTESSLYELRTRLAVYKPATAPFLQEITAEQFTRDLQQHISRPDTMSQGCNGTCGAAVLCKYLAEKHPSTYSDIAISLYESGKHTSTRLSLPPAMQHITPTDISSMQQSITDTIMQTAITRSNNMLLSYNPSKDMQTKKRGVSRASAGAASFMHPAFMWHFIRKRLKKKVSILMFPTISQLCSIDYCTQFVIALTHHNNWNFSFGMPNHYIQITAANGNAINYWSWGEYHTANIKNHAIHAVFVIEG